MVLQEEVGGSVPTADLDSCRVVGEVDNSILDSLEIGSLAILAVEHSVFPIGSGSTIETA